jgi:dipeptidyl aminopeptidase/acylaminoacyl peptidase
MRQVVAPMRNHFFTALVLIFVLSFAPPHAATARTLTLLDLRREVTLADPRISPDGSRVALLVGTNDFQTNRVVVRLDLLTTATGARTTLPLPFDDVSSPRWSPDGAQLAFIAARADAPHQLYVWTVAKARLHRLTSNNQDVEYFAWRPDGKAIAFVRADAPPQRHGIARFETSFEVGDNDYMTTAPPLPSHVWLVATQPPWTTQRLTQGPWSLPPGTHELSQPYLNALIAPQHFPNQFICWSRDGRHLALTAMPDPYIAHGDRAVMRVLDLSRVPAGWADLQPLTAHAGLEAGCDTSPDGTKIAYWYPARGHALDVSDIFVTTAAARGVNGLDVTRRLDRSPWAVHWMPDSLSLLVLAHDGTHEGMWRVSLDGTAQPLDLGDLNASGATVSRTGAIAFVASGPQTPTELYVMSNWQDRPRKLTSYNAAFGSLHLGAVRTITWTNDGFRENGVLTYPPGFVAGRLYPLVLQIHGWPQYASQAAFDTDYPGLSQLFAAHGYLVFEPNYRGSDDEGNAFETAIVGDTVAGPARDILAGIAAVERLGIVDKNEIAVSGWSYGGLLTAWLIGHDHRWKAAVAGAAPTDLPPDYAISSYNVLDRYFYGAPLWSSRRAYQVYVAQSPITYAWNITTPTLIVACTGDTTVPIVHSYELYHALRERGVPVQFIAYPSSEHYPSDPVSSEDVYRRWAGWLDRWLRPRDAGGGGTARH